MTRRRLAAGQRALDRERNADRFADDAERRRVEAQQLDVGQALRAADRHGKHRHARHPQPDGRFDRRVAVVPIAVGDAERRPRARQFSRRRGTAARRGRCRGPAPARRTAASTTSNRSRSGCQVPLRVSEAIACLARDGGGWSASRRRRRRGSSCWPRRRRARRSTASRWDGTPRPIPAD